ncbi:hypothetical protein KKB43_00415 [Patescibacteria group bacterium]|nr:hypothetical protein [Patescibacteria group bacterium]
MTIRSFLVGIAISTLICFIAWFAVIALSDPAGAGIGGLFLFYFSLFLWLSGFFVLIGFYSRTIFAPQKTPFNVLSNSTRQAIIFALAIDILLILKSMQMLNSINAILLIIFVIFTESYYLSSNHEHIRRNRKN